MTTVAVWGATGFIGRNLVNKLTRQGYTVRALIRQPLALTDELRGKVEEHVLDFSVSSQTLEQILRGVSCAIHCAGNPKSDTTGLDDFVRSVRNFSLAAAHAGVHKVVLVSSLSVYGYRDCGIVSADDSLSPDTDYGRSRVRAEMEAQKVLASSSTTLCIIRVPAVVGADMRSAVLRRFFSMLRYGWFFHPGQEDAVFPCLGINRLVELTSALMEASTDKKVSVVQLVDPIKWIEMATLYESVVGRRVRRVPLPPKLCRFFLAPLGRRAILAAKLLNNTVSYETAGVCASIISQLPSTGDDIRAMLRRA